MNTESKSLLAERNCVQTDWVCFEVKHRRLKKSFHCQHKLAFNWETDKEQESLTTQEPAYTQTNRALGQKAHLGTKIAAKGCRTLDFSKNREIKIRVRERETMTL